MIVVCVYAMYFLSFSLSSHSCLGIDLGNFPLFAALFFFSRF